MNRISNYWLNIENKKLFIAFFGFILVAIIMFIILAYGLIYGSYNSQESSNIDPNGPAEEYTKEQAELEKEFLDDDKASSRVSQLIDSLPYKGTYFSLSYDYGTLQFTLSLLQENESQGLSEYGNFIKANGIDASLVDENLIKTTSSSL